MITILFWIFPRSFATISKRKELEDDSVQVVVPPSTYPLDLKIQKNVITITDMDNVKAYKDLVYLSRESFEGSKTPRGVIL